MNLSSLYSYSYKLKFKLVQLNVQPPQNKNNNILNVELEPSYYIIVDMSTNRLFKTYIVRITDNKNTKVI